jgi:hypothetical protein
LPGQSGYWTALYRDNRPHIWTIVGLYAAFLSLLVALVLTDDKLEFDWEALFIIFPAFVYFIPSYIALHRRHPGRTNLLVTNILLGWALPVWIGLIVWATRRPPAVTAEAV